MLFNNMARLLNNTKTYFLLNAALVQLETELHTQPKDLQLKHPLV